MDLCVRLRVRVMAYLDQFGLQLDDLLPAIVPEVVASPEPVLRPLRDVGVEPR